MKRFCFALDLKNDEELIREYEAHHQQVWPEVIRSIRDSGIVQMQIYRFGYRLFMIMDTTDDFSLEKKADADNNNKIVQEWEQLMWKFQQPVEGANDNEKWVGMEKIFELNEF